MESRVATGTVVLTTPRRRRQDAAEATLNPRHGRTMLASCSSFDPKRHGLVEAAYPKNINDMVRLSERLVHPVGAGLKQGGPKNVVNCQGRTLSQGFPFKEGRANIYRTISIFLDT